MSRPVSNRWLQQNLLLRVGSGLAVLITSLSLLAPFLAPYDPVAIDLSLGLQAPSAAHLLGTDQLGRDVLSRLLWAGRSSITMAIVVMFLSLGVGLVVGLVSGFFGGLVEELCMRCVDFCAALPQIILALALIGTTGPSAQALIFALAITGWMPYARLVRSLVLATRSSDYVLAAQAIGLANRQIIYRYLLPAVAGPVAVQLSLNVGATILAIAGLSFLGLGIPPPTPEWGAMLVEARPFMDYAPHLVFPPGLAVFFMVFGFNSLAENLERRFRPYS